MPAKLIVAVIATKPLIAIKVIKIAIKIIKGKLHDFFREGLLRSSRVFYSI